MYCPRCSQLQISEEIKFCSRCGFPLGLVSEILAHGGFLPQLADLYKSKKIVTRRNGLIFSLFWFLIFVVVLALVAITDGPGELISSLVLLGTVGSLMMVIASFLILKKEPVKLELPNHKISNRSIHNIHGTQQTALPPTQSQPAQSYIPPANSWKAPNTGEFAEPQSVIEGTTKLLRKEDE